MRSRLLMAGALLAIAGSAAATPCYNPANGHYYEFFYCNGICWTAARDNAAAMFHQGLRGHLGTITSGEENAWIVANILPTGYSNASAAWIGGAQTPGASEPSGGWTWGVCTGEPWGYANWDSGNIDNSSGCEELTEMQLGNGTWGDAGMYVPGQDQTVGYVVEYDGLGPSSCATPLESCLDACPTPACTPTPRAEGCTSGGPPFTDVTAGPLANPGYGVGVAWGDYDNDGDLDLYITNAGQPNKLFRNEGGGVFIDATYGPLGVVGNGEGVVWGDYDNDGDLDLYLANFGQPNKLFRNEGGGVFIDATYGPLADSGYGVGVAWGDYDNDGDLDLYLANHGQLSRLFRNDGSGVFTDATSGPLIDGGLGTGVAWGDYDNDGDLDLYLAKYGQPNRLLRNDGGGAFTDVTSFPLADAGNGMGVAWGDYDNDGDLDLYLANWGQPNKLFRNDGGGVFADATSGPLADAGNSMGVAWGDYDNDGDLDLYVANNGQPNRLFRNDGGGVFTDAALGPLADAGNSAGVAWGDYDNDGDLDLYLVNNGQSSRLLRNEVGSLKHWLQVKLVGVVSNRSGIGARVTVVAGGVTQVREISGGSGFCSQNSLVAQFGLGSATSVSALQVRWPSGLLQSVTPTPAVDNLVVVVEVTSGPPAPAWTTATDAECGQVTVTWADVAGEDHYRVLRDGAEIASPPADIVSYIDVAPPPGPHQYCVQAVAGAALSAEVCDTGTAVDGAPALPAFETATTAAAGIHLSWSAVPSAEQYKVYRDGNRIATLPSSTLSIDDAPSGSGTSLYCVEATNICGPSTQRCVPLAHSCSPTSTSWARTYTAAFNDVVAIPEGGYAALTNSSLVRLDADGNVLWQHTYTIAGFVCYGLARAADGGFAIAGRRSGGGPNLDALMIRCDASGDTLWTRTVGGPGRQFFGAVASAPDGAWILSGGTGSSLWIVRLDASSYTAWTGPSDGSLVLGPTGVAVTTDGGLVACGGSSIIKRNATGAELWSYPETYPVREVVACSDGDVLASGDMVVRLDTAGSPLWEYWDDPSLSRAAFPATDGGAWLGGMGGAGVEGNPMACVARLNPQGALLYVSAESDSGTSTVNAMDHTPDESLILAGATNRSGGTKGYLVKRDCLEPGSNVGVLDQPADVPSLALGAPQPNPASSGFQYAVSLPRRMHVRVGLYDPAGRLVRQLVDQELPAGRHQLGWMRERDSGIGPGIYFLNLVGDSHRQTRTIVLLE